MKKQKTTKKPKVLEMTLAIDTRFKVKNNVNFNPAIKKAAIKIINELHKNHFNSKDCGWPISYSHIEDEVFYEAFGHNLEDYILPVLAKKNQYSMAISKNLGGGWVIVKDKKRAKKK